MGNCSAACYASCGIARSVGEGIRWCRAGDEHQRGQQAGGAESVVQVTDDGPGDDDPGGARQALDQAHADEDRGIGGDGAQEARRDVHGQSGQEGAASAEGVAEGPDDQLAQGDPGHEGGQGELGDGL
ncbi:hypothetical protein GCM10010306_102860 [Streptomyces umbrinus]|nr:hypothetical protein GCM10010306_102860 [Streptomyces umbrinus]